MRDVLDLTLPQFESLLNQIAGILKDFPQTPRIF